MSSDDESGSGETLAMRFWRIPRPKRRYLKKQLPELKEESRVCIENFLSYRAPRTRAEFPRSRSAAVVVALFVGREGDLYVLLNRRAAELRTYAGDTALPGGKVEPEDRSIEDTARREAFEEIGLPQDRVKVPLLCVMEPFLARNQVIVTPVVVLILDKTLQPRLNETEVASLFSHPLKSFLDSTPPFPAPTGEPYHTWSDHPFGETGTTRVHRFLTGREAGGIKPVFGLTANILITAASLGYGRPPSFEAQPPNAPTPRQQIARAIIMPGSALHEACRTEGINPDGAAGRLLRPPFALNAPRVLEWARIGAQWDDLLSDDEDSPRVKPQPTMHAAAPAAPAPTATVDPASAADIVDAAPRRGFVPPPIPIPPTPPTSPESGPAARGKSFRGDGFGKNYRGPGRDGGWDEAPVDPVKNKSSTKKETNTEAPSSTDASKATPTPAPTPSSDVPSGPQGPTAPTGAGMEDPEQGKTPVSIEGFVGRVEREIENRIAQREGRPARPEWTYPNSSSSSGAKKTAKADGVDAGNGLTEVNIDVPASVAGVAVAEGGDGAPKPEGEPQRQPAKPLNPKLERLRKWGEESQRRWQPKSSDDSDSDSDPAEGGEGREWNIPRLPKREDGQESRWGRRRREKREQRQQQQGGDSEGEGQERPRRQWRWPAPPQAPNAEEKHNDEAPHTFEKPVPAPPVSPEAPKADAAPASIEHNHAHEVVAAPLDPAAQALLDEKAAKQAEKEAARAAKNAANQEELAQLTGFKKLGRFLDQTKEMVQERYDELVEDEEKLAIARERYPVVMAEIRERLASVRRGDWKEHMAAHMSGAEEDGDEDDDEDGAEDGHREVQVEQPQIQAQVVSVDDTVEAARKTRTPADPNATRTSNPKAKESIERGKNAMREGLRRLDDIEGFEEGRRSGMENMREGLRRGLKNAREGVEKGKEGVDQATEADGVHDEETARVKRDAKL